MSESELLPSSNALTIIPAPSGTALAIIPNIASLPVLLNADRNDILGKLKAELAGYKPDATTDAGRKEIGSKARKVGVAKQDLLRVAAELKKDAQATIKAVNAEERVVETNCDEIRDSILAPLEQYKQIERDRVAAHEAELVAMEDLARFDEEPTPAQITERIEALSQMRGTRNWQEFSNRAVETFSAIDQRLFGMHALAVKRGEEAAELERLRAAEAERQVQEAARIQADHEARIKREAAEAARLEAERIAERDRQEVLRAAAEERARIERAAQMADYHRRMLQHVKDCGFGFIGGEPQPSAILQRELTDKIEFSEENFGDLLPQAWAARGESLELIQRAIDDGARRLAEEEARRDAERREREAQERAEKSERARLAAIEQAKADIAAAQAEALALAERARKAKIAAEQQAIWDRDAAVAAEQKRVADEKAKADAEEARRAQDKAHRGQIHRDILAALVGCGAAESMARTIIASMARGEVPHVSIAY